MEHPQQSQGEQHQAPARLDRALKGSLPCIRCGYELQGLSVRGACPECGTAVRATILHTVDPHAEALQPLRWRRLAVLGLLLWGGGALTAALCAWAPRLAELGSAAGLTLPVARVVRTAGLVVPTAAGLSTLGALLAMVVAVPGAASRERLRALAGVCLGGVLVWLLYTIHMEIDQRQGPWPYLGGEPPLERTLLRLGVEGALGLGLLAIRPAARRYVERSLVLRTGRVDRQTIYATIAAAGVAALGDLIRLASLLLQGPGGDVADAAGVTLVAVGSGLLTLALGGVFLDTVRIVRALCAPAPSLRSVLGEEG